MIYKVVNILFIKWIIGITGNFFISVASFLMLVCIAF